MKNKILSVILASLLVAGLVGTVAFAADDNRAITLPEVSFTSAEPEPGTTAPITGSESDGRLAKGIVFKADSGYIANTYTGYVSGPEFNTSCYDFVAKLEDASGISVERETENGRIPLRADTIMHGDKVVLVNEDLSVVTELTIIFMGNADMNDVINISDVSAMLKLIAGWNIDADEVAADVDGSGNVNLSDVSAVLKKIAGWNIEFVREPVLPGKYEMVNRSESAFHSAPAGTAWQPLCLSDGIHYDLGVKFTVKEGEFATSITALCPSWGDDKGKLTFSVYKWTGDYDTTVAAMPVITNTAVDYTDNSTITTALTDSSGKGLMEGEYLWRIHDGADAGEGTGVGIWFYPEMGPAEDSGMKTFLNCEEFNLGPVASIHYATAK